MRRRFGKHLRNSKERNDLGCAAGSYFFGPAESWELNIAEGALYATVVYVDDRLIVSWSKFANNCIMPQGHYH